MIEEDSNGHLKKEIASIIANSVKQATGKGPTKSWVHLQDNYVLVEMWGHLLPTEIKVSKTETGFFDVKLNRMKWVNAHAEKLMEQLTCLLGKKATNFFYDVDPKTDKAIALCLFE